MLRRSPQRGVFPFVWLSPRGILVLLLLAGVIAAASIVSWLLWVACLLTALFIAAIIDDLRYARKISNLRIVREQVGRLLLGRSATITYSIENQVSAPVRIGIFETPLVDVTFESDSITVVLPAGTAKRIDQRILAKKRGKIRFGDLYFWVEIGFGFLRRRYRISAEEEVEVFPDLSMVERYGAFMSRRTLLETGLRKLRLRGAGSELESLREYVPGDAFRSIDWKATARRGRMIAQQYEVERNAQVIVLLDCGRFMTVRMGDLRKFDYVLTAALSVIRIAQAADDQVGLSAFAGCSLLNIPPRRGSTHAAGVIRAVFDMQPRFEESDYDLAFADIENRYTKRGLIVFFTDIFDPLASAKTLIGLGRLAKKHVVLCALMNDAAIAAVLSEEPKTSAQAYRFGVATALADERRSAVVRLRSLGVTVLDVPAERLTTALLDAYLDLKARARV